MFRILVVDDEHPIREWLVHTIRSNRSNFFVDSAQNGLEALEKCKASAFDLLITDIRMPHMDGLELLKDLSEINQDTGVIVLSSYDDYNYVRNAFKFNAVDYLLKTEIDNDKLLTAIDNFCSANTVTHSRNQLQPIIKKALLSSETSAPAFLQELSKFGNLTPHGTYYCFLIKAEGDGGDFKPFLPTIENTVVRFCLPNSANMYIGCVELTMQPSLLVLMQTQIMFLKKLQTYNRLSLLLYSDIMYEVEQLLACLQNLYSSRDLDFYDVHYYKPALSQKSLELQFNKRYIEIIEQLRGQHYSEIAKQAVTFLQFAKSILYPNVDALKILCIKICESTYLNNYNIDLMKYHTYTQRLSPLFFAATSLQQLQDLLVQGINELNIQNGANTYALSSRIAQAVSIVEEQYMDLITLVSVADDLHINPEYLSRSFKKQVGINFNTYLTNVRLQHALELLKRAEIRISEIAISTGFQNPAYFSKCFKAAFGLSPQQWRASDAADTICKPSNPSRQG